MRQSEGAARLTEASAVKPSGRRLGRALRRRRRLRAGVAQLIYVLAGIVLAVLLPHTSVGFTVAGPQATEMLAALGGGLLAVIGIAFSLLFLVVQFGPTTFGHRLNLFQGSRFVWNVFGFFTGTILFAFTAVFSIGDAAQTSGLVPVVAIVLVLLSIVLFRLLMTHALAAIRLPSILAQVSEQGQGVIQGVYPDAFGTATGDGRVEAPGGPFSEVRWPGRPAVLQMIEVASLVSRVTALKGAVVFQVAVGDVLQERAVVARVYGSDPDALVHAVLRALQTGQERTFDQDPGFAFRVLSDIGLRALSPAINDPFTAVQSIDAIEGLLRTLALRDLTVGDVGEGGELRVAFVLPTWEDYLALAMDELIEAAQAATVHQRLEMLLRDLVDLVPEERRPPLVARLDAGRF